jgi:hypothetical protein
VGGGEFTREDKALQTASEAAQMADQKYAHLCQLLPSYSSDREAFYHARDQMFDLIRGTEQVASAVATQTGQAPPAPPPVVPTAASAAATDAGTNPAKGIANVPSTTPPPPPSASPAASPAAQSLAHVTNANQLKAWPKKGSPRRRRRKSHRVLVIR